MAKVNNLIAPQLIPPRTLDLRIAFLSTYPPKRCGIGTYTKDLATGINTLNPERLAEIIALDDDGSVDVTYPWEVSRRIHKEKWEDYETVLEYLNKSIIDVLCIQHEFGIFGGADGEFIVPFIEKLEKPYVVTYHSVLREPKENQKRIIQAVCRKASAIVVMLPLAVDILHDVYGVPKEKIVPIHHGAPDFPLADSSVTKQELGLEDRLVMTNVNLLGPGRGIEFAIKALPKVVKRYPNFLYQIVGQTHPGVIAHSGETYRQSLEALVKKLNLEYHVRFINEYVSLEDLITYVKASDFYVTPYEDMEAISSGALAYAIAAGKLCIATPYRYAREVLAGGKGYLVPPKTPEAITKAILHAMANPKDAQLMRQKCYAEGRKMIWERVGFHYLRIMDHVAHAGHPTRTFPEASLKHLEAMTDATGLLEHSHYDDRNQTEGYAVDDNARGLVVALQHNNKKLAQIYLDFMIRSETDGKLHCDADHEGNFTHQPGLGDWFGRTFWAAAYAMRYGTTMAIRTKATDLVRKFIPSLTELSDARTWSYVLMGLALLQDVEWEECAQQRATALKEGIAFLKKAYATNKGPSWHWIDTKLTYDNPRVPAAILEVARAFNQPELQDWALNLLQFVLDRTFDFRGNHFRFIGNKGWLKKGKEDQRAWYDEQPLEAGATVFACFLAYQMTGLEYYRDMAIKAFAWFHGDNILRRPLYNPARHSIHDGLEPTSLNQNQGAECIVEYLMAYTCYAKLELIHDLT